MQLHHRRMMALMAFADDVAPPAEHGGRNSEHPQKDEELAIGIVMHPHHHPAEEGERRRGADDRPHVRRKDVIIVVLGRGHRSFPRISSRGSSGAFPDFPPDKMYSLT